MINHKWGQMSQFTDSKDSPGFLLWKTQITWKRLIEKTLHIYGLTHPQFVVLASIAYFTTDEKHITQVELARHTSIDVNTISQILRLLEKKELIKRTNKIDNEKSKYPKLTDLGYQTLKPAVQAVENADNEFFKKLSFKELTTFKSIASKLINFT